MPFWPPGIKLQGVGLASLPDLLDPSTLQGHELEFILAPNLHWPDTMFS